MTVTVTMNDQGRVVLPAELRRQLGIRPGQQLVAYVDSGRLILEDRAHLVRRLQDDYRQAGPSGSAVDELVAERRAEAAREDSS